MQEWVQLNYDGLAQKAGCPQEALMEVVAIYFVGCIASGQKFQRAENEENPNLAIVPSQMVKS